MYSNRMSTIFVIYCLRRQKFGDEWVAEAVRAAARDASQKQGRAAVRGARQQQARAAKAVAQRERPRASAADVRYG